MDLFHVAAIIFDNDGVLVDSERIHVAVERELLAQMGLDYDLPTYMARFVGLNNADFQARLAHDFMARYGAAFPSDFRARLDARAWPRLEAELEPIANVADLVRTFDGPVAVASSATTARLRQKLNLTGLHDLFAPHIYSADLVANGKPAPDLFLHAARALHVAPDQCLVIEDSEHGIIAARAANMIPFGFTGGGHSDRGHADRLMRAGAAACFSAHGDIKTWLEKRSLSSPGRNA